tara:strand:- start:98 stop:514 length:417 start_codon:yes stop_codon:yes gene_type:complete
MARKSQRLRRQRRIERMKAKEQEAKLTKVVEDNSVVLERMKNVSNSCDKILQTFEPKFNTTVDTPETEEETLEEPSDIRAPMLKMSEPPPEIKETIKQTPNFKTMTKKNLVKFAKENNVKVYAAMTKANIIKAIEANL